MRREPAASSACSSWSSSAPGFEPKKGGTKTAANFSKSRAETPDLADRRLGEDFFCRQERHAIGMRSKKGMMLETRTIDISKCRNLDMLTGTCA